MVWARSDQALFSHRRTCPRESRCGFFYAPTFPTLLVAYQHSSPQTNSIVETRAFAAADGHPHDFLAQRIVRNVSSFTG